MRRDKGFTLIELAIVLVIIGIIIGMVLKGQDLIQNARAKSFVNKVRAWEVAQWTFYDRKGRFAGDCNRDGKIGDTTASCDVKQDLTGANFIYPPYEGTSGSETNTISVGSYTFYVFFGTDGDPTATPATGKNIMVICKASDCGTAFTQDELIYVEALDASLDGVADGTQGQVICDDAGPTTESTTTWVAYNGISAVACDTNAEAIVYYFDAKRQ